MAKMKPRTKKIMWGVICGVLVLGWFGSQQDKKTALSALEKGRASLEAQDWSAAISEFEDSLAASELYSSLSSEQAQAHIGRGTALAMLGQPNAAVQSFTLAYSIEPTAAPTTDLPAAVEASENARASIRATQEEAGSLMEAGKGRELASDESETSSPSTKEQLLEALNKSVALMGDKWEIEELAINAREGGLWLDLDLARKSPLLTEDQVRSQAALVITWQSETLESLFSISNVHLKCGKSTGSWTISNMKYANNMMQDEDTFQAGTVVLLTSME